MRIRFKTKSRQDGTTEPAGKLYEMPEDKAKVYIAKGLAVEVPLTAEEKAAEEAAKKAQEEAAKQAEKEAAKAAKEAEKRAPEEAAKKQASGPPPAAT